MTSKIMLGAVIAIAFLAGTIATGSIAYAAQTGDDLGLVAVAIDNLAAIISGKDTAPIVNVSPTPITVNAPQGEQGIQGEQGSAANIKTYIERAPYTSGDTSISVEVFCDTGDTVLGGGFFANGDDIVTKSVPITSDGSEVQNGEVGIGWSTSAHNNVNSPNTAAWAICLDNLPFRD